MVRFCIFVALILLGVSLRLHGLVLRNNSSSPSINITFFATNLQGCDLISKCDASVTILCFSIYSDWKVCGNTRRILNNNSPVWPEMFTFVHQPGTSQRWRFDLKDHNLIGSKLLHSFYIFVDNYAERTGNLLENEIPDNKGSLWVHRLGI